MERNTKDGKRMHSFRENGQQKIKNKTQNGIKLKHKKINTKDGK